MRIVHTCPPKSIDCPRFSGAKRGANIKFKYRRFAGRMPSPAVIYGKDSNGKARAQYDRITEFLTANPERIALLICLEDELPFGKASKCFLFCYRAHNVRYPNDWHPEIYEISQSANLFGDVEYYWNKAAGDVTRENTYLLKLLRQEAALRPEATHATASTSDQSSAPRNRSSAVVSAPVEGWSSGPVAALSVPVNGLTSG